MSTGGSKSREHRQNQVPSGAGKQSVRKSASYGEAGKVSPNSHRRGQDNGGKK